MPRFGWKGAQRVAPSARQMGVLSWQVGRVRGDRGVQGAERAGAHRQVLGVQLCALYQNLWRGTGAGVIFHCPLRSWLNVLLLTDQIQEYAVGLETGTEIIASDFKL